MPNKPHPPRSKPAKASQGSAAALNGEDTSFIVFGDGKTKKKTGGGGNKTISSGPLPSVNAANAAADVNGKKKKASSAGNATPTGLASSGSGKAGSSNNVAANNNNNASNAGRDGNATGISGTAASNRPDTRTLVSGSSSWTGKLPVNLLSEHCQRAKWEKPEYTLSRAGSASDGSGKGYIAGVLLKRKNPKTGAVATLPVMLMPAVPLAVGDDGHDDGAIVGADMNARPARPRERVLVRDSAVEARHLAACWALFRVASGKNLGMALPPAYRDLWKGEFKVIKDSDVKDGKAGLYDADPFAARVRFEEEKATRERERSEREDRREKERKAREEGKGLGAGKGWSKAPKVDMGRKMRREVEGLIRKSTRWNVYGVRLDEQQKTRIVDQVEAMGFRRSHAEEAVQECRDKEETLEWLLIHVPEDDLPPWCLPENYTAGVSLATSDIQRENKIKRLAAAGYATELAAEALTLANEDEDSAAEYLQDRLLGRVVSSAVVDTGPSNVWAEELLVVESIFGDRFRRQGRGCYIKLEVVDREMDISVLVRPARRGYPTHAPVISIEAKLPAYIRLAITKQAIDFGLSDQIGEQMIFHLVDWLEQHIDDIMNNPGSLKSLSTAVGAEDSSRAPRTDDASFACKQRISVRAKTQDGATVLQEWRNRQRTIQQEKMNATRQGLPAWQLRSAIVSAVNASQVTIISGETGSGKSTQSVQFILDDMIQQGRGGHANIICTQPRRISALGLADRVADERCSSVGQEVGYAIRGESRQKPGTTRITFVTTGVLLRRLQTSGSDLSAITASLADVSHIVIDEVHERTLDTDFLMTLLRDVLKMRKDLRLVLMSATLDADLFEKYFASSASVAKVQIAGRTHPVTDVYLEEVLRLTSFAGQIGSNDDDDDPGDNAALGAAIRAVGARINYDLVATVVDFIDHDLKGKGDDDAGAILVFLPGVAEIDRALNAIRRISSDFHALPLHASLQSADQRRVFPRAPKGKRKVICATNVAETSITIEDVVAVIDTGKVKETIFDAQAGIVRLEEIWASKAACKQRRGRAGRVTAGTCYKLFTSNLEATKMPERSQPEIKRVALEQLCLSVKAMGVEDVHAFLNKAITPPETTAVANALVLLARMGVLDAGSLTALGRHLALLPTDLRCGKLLVLGSVFGCLDSCLTIAAILSVKSPFVSPADKREEAKAARLTFSDGGGDLLCDMQAVRAWQERRSAGEPHGSLRRWCGENFLSAQTLQDIWNAKSQYLANLKDLEFVPFDYRSEEPSQLDRYSKSTALLRALLAAAFTPQIARIDYPDAKYIASVSGTIAQDPEARTIKFYSEKTDATAPGSNDRVFIHPSSALFTAQSYANNTAFMAYFGKMATSKVFIRDLTPCNAFSLLMFGGSLKLAAQNGGGITIDDWIRIRGWARIGVLVSRLRGMLDELLVARLDQPRDAVVDTGLVDVVRRLIELNGMDH